MRSAGRDLGSRRRIGAGVAPGEVTRADDRPEGVVGRVDRVDPVVRPIGEIVGLGRRVDPADVEARRVRVGRGEGDIANLSEGRLNRAGVESGGAPP
jgi:hypothetical protein